MRDPSWRPDCFLRALPLRDALSQDLDCCLQMIGSAGPERQRHLEQVMANDSHIAELSRQARQTMGEPSRG